MTTTGVYLQGNVGSFSVTVGAGGGITVLPKGSSVVVAVNSRMTFAGDSPFYSINDTANVVYWRLGRMGARPVVDSNFDCFSTSAPIDNDANSPSQLIGVLCNSSLTGTGTITASPSFSIEHANYDHLSLVVFTAKADVVVPLGGYVFGVYAEFSAKGLTNGTVVSNLNWDHTFDARVSILQQVPNLPLTVYMSSKFDKEFDLKLLAQLETDMIEIKEVKDSDSLVVKVKERKENKKEDVLSSNLSGGYTRIESPNLVELKKLQDKVKELETSVDVQKKLNMVKK